MSKQTGNNELQSEQDTSDAEKIKTWHDAMAKEFKETQDRLFAMRQMSHQEMLKQ